MRDVLLFDFGGTLDADGDRWAVRLHSAYSAAGGRLPLEEFEPLFRESDRQLERDPAVRTMGFGAMIAAQVERLRASLPDGRSVDFRCVGERFHRDASNIAARNRGLLEELARRYRMGVVANFTGNLDRCLAELDLRRFFSVTADSALVGWSKPDPRIFYHALDVLGAEPGRAWMIGDNFEADIRPAAALGLGTCWLAPLGRPAPTESLATGRIASLTDLPSLLG